jgi:hypothetical protein
VRRGNPTKSLRSLGFWRSGNPTTLPQHRFWMQSRISRTQLNWEIKNGRIKRQFKGHEQKRPGAPKKTCSLSHPTPALAVILKIGKLEASSKPTRRNGPGCWFLGCHCEEPVGRRGNLNTESPAPFGNGRGIHLSRKAL